MIQSSTISWETEPVMSGDGWPQRAPQPDLSFLNGIATEDLVDSDKVTKAAIELWPQAILYSVLAGWQDDIAKRESELKRRNLTNRYHTQVKDLTDRSNKFKLAARHNPPDIDFAEINWSELLSLGWRGTMTEAAMWRALECAIRACAILDRIQNPPALSAYRR